MRSGSYQLPDKLLPILLDRQVWDNLFREIAMMSADMSCDWLNDYYQREQGDRDSLKQDFTPNSLSAPISKLLPSDEERIADICAGTGVLAVKTLAENRQHAFFHCEEVSSRTIPFLCSVKVVVRGVPKSTELGKLEVGATTDTKNTIEVNYIKITVDQDTILEIDKYNYICNINGTDYLAAVREALGLA